MPETGTTNNKKNITVWSQQNQRLTPEEAHKENGKKGGATSPARRWTISAWISMVHSDYVLQKADHGIFLGSPE